MFKTNKSIITVALGILICAAHTAGAYTDEDFTQLVELNSRLQEAEASVFAPKNFAEYQKHHAKLNKLKSQNAKADKIDKAIEKCREFGENALKATDVTKKALSEYLEPRERAIAAKAPDLQPALYSKGEAQFIKATAKIERGDIKNGLKQVPKALPIFDRAELEAIRSQVLNEADRLIATAIQDQAKKYALITLDKATSHRAKSSAIIDVDRYDRAAAESEAAVAEYEARHATELAQRVRSLKKNDQAWEQIMLSYEIFMQQAADGRKLKLNFDMGSSAAAKQLSAEMVMLTDSIKSLDAAQTDFRNRVTELCARLGIDYDKSEGVGAAGTAGAALEALESEFGTLVRELDDVRGEVRLTKSDLKRTREEKETASAILAVKQDEERRFNETKSLFAPTEALTLYNASRDIVIRLRGLTFSSGRFELEERHNNLLSKVTKALVTYEGRQVIIEGHTDNTGSSGINRSLSEKRALAVMDYLRQSTGRPASDFRAIGYGAEKPVANNQSRQGRAENRRIDIVILR
ncbi:MAG: OmpA family protein [candidate division Zixibacteria bacterium]|nr:OmpA family protein [candidate division Zixibacteria bacterium]